MGLFEWPEENMGILVINDKIRKLKNQLADRTAITESIKNDKNFNLINIITKKTVLFSAILLSAIVLIISITIMDKGDPKINHTTETELPNSPTNAIFVEKKDLAKAILKHYKNDQKSLFRYVGFLKNNYGIKPFIAYPISSESQEKHLKTLEKYYNEDQGIVVTNNLLECILKNLTGEWYIIWDGAYHKWKQIEIGYKVESDRKLNDLIKDFSSKCSEASLTVLKQIAPVEPSILNNKLNNFLEKKNISELNNILIQKIFFLAETKQRDIFLAWSIRDNGYGNLISIQNTVISEHFSSEFSNKKKIVDTIVKMLDCKTGRLRITNPSIIKNITDKIPLKTGQDIELTGEVKKKVISVLTENFLQKLGEK